MFKYKYILFPLHLFAILNFFQFYYLQDIFSYVGFIIHFTFVIFYIINFKIFSFRSRKLFFLTLILFLIFLFSDILNTKLIYSSEEELIFVRNKRIIILLLVFFIFLLIYFEFYRIHYKRIIKKFLIFLMILILYLTWGNFLILIDITYPTTIVYKLLYYQSMHLNEFNDVVKFIPKEMLLPGVELLKGTNGNFYPIFPLLPSILTFVILIFFKLFCIPFASLKIIPMMDFFIKHDILKFHEIFQFQRVVASFISFLSVILFYRFLRSLLPNISLKRIYFYVVLYALGSIHWSISSLNLWQHTYIEFFNLVFLIFFVKFLKKQHYKFLFLLAFLQGILFYLRPTTIFITILPMTYIIYFLLRKDIKLSFKKSIIYFFLGYCISILPLAFLNLNTYGNPIGGYLIALLSPENHDVEFSLRNYFKNFLGILFSPNYGFFVFQPYFFVSILIYFLYKSIIFENLKEENYINKILIFISFFIILFYWLFYSSNVQWTGFYNYGTRMLSDILIYFFLIMIHILEITKNFLNQFLRFFLNISFGMSFLIQIYGTYSLHLFGDWYCDVRKKRDYHLDVEKKVWDFQDPLFFHKIWYRSQPIFKKNTIIYGEKVCSGSYAVVVDSYLFFDKNLVSKITKNMIEQIQKKRKKDLSIDDLLFYYYFFVNKRDYHLQIHLENFAEEIKEIRIYIKNSRGIQEFKFDLKPASISKNEILTIPISGAYFQERITFFAFSKNYEQLLLKKIELIQK